MISPALFIEVLVVLTIVGFQIYLYTNTRRKIQGLYDFIPDKEDLEIQDSNEMTPISEYAELTPVIENYQKIVLKSDERSTFDEALNSINDYLKENRNSILQFEIISDICNRKIDEELETVESEVPIPLYVGLIGTIVGIIFGLFSIAADENIASVENFSLGSLLSGVGVAMVASLIGIGLYVFNSIKGIIPAKHFVLEKKNNLFDFIQSKLLPRVNKDLGDVFNELKVNLDSFNESFERNINNASRSWESNRETLENQEKILAALQNIELGKVAEANIKIYRELNENIESLEQFNQYLTNLNEMINSTQNVSSRLDNILRETDEVVNIANNVNGNLRIGNGLLEYAQANIDYLRDPEQVVHNIDAAMRQGLETFQEVASANLEETRQVLANIQVEYENMYRNLDPHIFNNLNHLNAISQEMVRQGHVLDNINEASNVMPETTVKLDASNIQSTTFPKGFKVYMLLIFTILAMGMLYFMAKDIYMNIF